MAATAVEKEKLKVEAEASADPGPKTSPQPKPAKKEPLTFGSWAKYGKVEHRGREDGAVLTFDLSEIRAEHFDTVLAGLAAFGGECAALEFNTAAHLNDKSYFERVPIPRGGGNYPPRGLQSVSDSIWGDPQLHCGERLVVELGKVVPTARKLRKLTLRGLDLDDQSFEILAQMLSRAGYLRKFKIADGSVSADQFGLLSEGIAHRGLVKLSLKRAHLGDDIDEILQEAFRKQAEIQRIEERRDKAVGLVTITRWSLKGNKFSQSFAQHCAGLVDQWPEAVIDLRENATLLTKVSARVLISPETEAKKLRRLKSENAALWKKLGARVGGLVPFGIVADDLYVVGTRAQEFIAHLLQLDDFYTHMREEARSSVATQEARSQAQSVDHIPKKGKTAKKGRKAGTGHAVGKRPGTVRRKGKSKRV